jgi:hypothetical protein
VTCTRAGTHGHVSLQVQFDDVQLALLDESQAGSPDFPFFKELLSLAKE